MCNLVKREKQFNLWIVFSTLINHVRVPFPVLGSLNLGSYLLFPVSVF